MPSGAKQQRLKVAELLKEVQDEHPGATIGSYPFYGGGKYGADFVVRSDDEALANAAGRSLSVGRPHAASDLADLVERVGGGLSPLPVGLEPRRPLAYAGTGVPA